MWAAGLRMGCVTPTLPMQALGSPQLCPQAQILSVLMWDPCLCQNTLFSAQKHDQGPSLPHTQMSGNEASCGPLGPADTRYRYVCIYIFLYRLYIEYICIYGICVRRYSRQVAWRPACWPGR